MTLKSCSQNSTCSMPRDELLVMAQAKHDEGIKKFAAFREERITLLSTLPHLRVKAGLFKWRKVPMSRAMAEQRFDRGGNTDLSERGVYSVYDAMRQVWTKVLQETQRVKDAIEAAPAGSEIQASLELLRFLNKPIV